MSKMLRSISRLNSGLKLISQRQPSMNNVYGEKYLIPSIYQSITKHPMSHQFDRQSVGALDELERTFVRPEYFVKSLKENDFNFYCGVPDSLLKDLCGYITDNIPDKNHVIVANEGSAIGVASGYYLNTGRIPIVYFQNSGLGNAVNPLLSLTHQDVYSIPILLLIGWRGEIGKKDEPQHLVMGKVMCDMLKLMNIPYDILPDYEQGIQHSIQTAAQYLRNNSAPYALLVRKRTFEKYNFVADMNDEHYLPDMISRKETLQIVVDNIDKNAAFISTTGFTSRELYEIRKDYQSMNQCRDVKEFLTVGSMGHASSIALGMAQSMHVSGNGNINNNDKRDIVCIDGDGAVLMHMGVLSNVGNSNLSNYKHILINNGCHDSVGGQPTDGFKTDFVKIAKACGYKKCVSVKTKEEITKAIQELNKEQGPYFLEIKTIPGANKNLSRPSSTPAQNKHDFMSFVSKGQ